MGQVILSNLAQFAGESIFTSRNGDEADKAQGEATLR
jgi:hypothetical protein